MQAHQSHISRGRRIAQRVCVAFGLIWIVTGAITGHSGNFVFASFVLGLAAWLRWGTSLPLRPLTPTRSTSEISVNVPVGAEDTRAAADQARSLAAGGHLPSLPAPIPLSPGESLVARTPCTVARYSGDIVSYRKGGMLIFGNPGLTALSLAASAWFNASQRRRAERRSAPQWRQEGVGELLLTSHRLVVQGQSTNLAVPLADIRTARSDGAALMLTGGDAAPVRLAVSSPSLLFVQLHYLRAGEVCEVAAPGGIDAPKAHRLAPPRPPLHTFAASPLPRQQARSGGFSFAVPPGWTLFDSEQLAAATRALAAPDWAILEGLAGPRAENYGSSITIVETALLTPDESTDDWWWGVPEVRHGATDWRVLGSGQRVAVDGVEGVWVTFAYPFDGIVHYRTEILFSRATRLTWLVVMSAASIHGAVTEDLRQVLGAWSWHSDAIEPRPNQPRQPSPQ